MTPLECSHLFLKAWQARSASVISQLFAEDGVFINPLQPKPLVGPQQILATISSSIDKLESIEVRVTNAFEQGHSACVEGEFLSRKRVDGTRFDFPFSMVLELKSGKITRLSEYFDTDGLR